MDIRRERVDGVVISDSRELAMLVFRSFWNVVRTKVSDRSLYLGKRCKGILGEGRHDNLERPANKRLIALRVVVVNVARSSIAVSRVSHGEESPGNKKGVGVGSVPGVTSCC